MNCVYLGIIIARLYFLTAPECTVSWYGIEFQGNETASGLIYDMNELTCAHPTLPLGSIIRFWNEETGVWLTCRVTDRGPFAVNSDGYAVYPLRPHPSRQFDISIMAFCELSGGNLDDGLMVLRWRVIGVDQSDMLYNTHIPAGRLCELMRMDW
jgi:rare lipoprotein A